MLIKPLAEVATRKEKVSLTNVRWKRMAYGMRRLEPREPKGGPGEDASSRGLITGLWSVGCALTTHHILRVGDRIWIQAADDSGQTVLSHAGTVIWSENSFRSDEYRCEVRFRDELPAQ